MDILAKSEATIYETKLQNLTKEIEVLKGRIDERERKFQSDLAKNQQEVTFNQDSGLFEVAMNSHCDGDILEHSFYVLIYLSLSDFPLLLWTSGLEMTKKNHHS